MQDILPADSAFVGGNMVLPDSSVPSVFMAAGWDCNRLVVTLVAFLLLVAIFNGRKILNLFPSLVGCLLRWREAMNLENSVTMVRDRNFMFFLLLLPVFLILAVYRVYCPDFLCGLDEPLYYLSVSGIFAAYFLLRDILNYVMKPRSLSKAKIYGMCRLSFRSYFIITELLVSLTFVFFSVFPVDGTLAPAVILGEISLSYIVFLLRKIQILANNFSVLSSILYLCGLEFLPTVLLLISGLTF